MAKRVKETKFYGKCHLLLYYMNEVNCIINC